MAHGCGPLGDLQAGTGDHFPGDFVTAAVVEDDGPRGPILWNASVARACGARSCAWHGVTPGTPRRGGIPGQCGQCSMAMAWSVGGGEGWRRPCGDGAEREREEYI